MARKVRERIIFIQRHVVVACEGAEDAEQRRRRAAKKRQEKQEEERQKKSQEIEEGRTSRKVANLGLPGSSTDRIFARVLASWRRSKAAAAAAEEGKAS
eukprot:12399314-Karenia_brevis.AAC.1